MRNLGQGPFRDDVARRSETMPPAQPSESAAAGNAAGSLPSDCSEAGGGFVGKRFIVVVALPCLNEEPLLRNSFSAIPARPSQKDGLNPAGTEPTDGRGGGPNAGVWVLHSAWCLGPFLCAQR